MKSPARWWLVGRIGGTTIRRANAAVFSEMMAMLEIPRPAHRRLDNATRFGDRDLFCECMMRGAS